MAKKKTASHGRTSVRSKKPVHPQTPDHSVLLDDDEKMAAVCNLFIQGYNAPKIAELMKRTYGIEMTREQPYGLIRQAASRGWFRFVARPDSPLALHLRTNFGFLREAEVVHGVHDDLANHSAEMLLRLVRSRCQIEKKNVVHIGWSGGNSVRQIARQFADLLCRPTTGLPEVVCSHSLVAGFDVDMPMNAPNAFFAYFESPEIQVTCRYVGLHAPALVHTDEIARLRKLPGIREAFDKASEVDIVVTSAACLEDCHSMLTRYYTRYSENESDTKRFFEKLSSRGCKGDMLWQPLAADGPLDCTQFPYRSMTVLDLTQVRAMIRRGAYVLLSLGPCSRCGLPKTNILHTILCQNQPLITHLITDSRTARGLFAGD
jgi:DNA-binding transcriptional regulator LsrR (DeoR family)